ncbi:MAG: hypothetical protein AAFU49_23775 [Pseudomonadota bacterium]
MTPDEQPIKREDLCDPAEHHGVTGPAILYLERDVGTPAFAAALAADFSLWAVVARARAEALEDLDRHEDAERVRECRVQWRRQAHSWLARC